MKNYLVVGAGKGIGLKTAELLKAGNQVFAITRNLTPELESMGASVILMDVAKDSLDQLQGIPDELHGLPACGSASPDLADGNRRSPRLPARRAHR